ncbi:hypothetical protein U1Q18_044599 [Sarracenia purpurea var. burkii]
MMYRGKLTRFVKTKLRGQTEPTHQVFHFPPLVTVFPISFSLLQPLLQIVHETPKFEVIRTTDEYEIRKHSPSVIAEVTYDPTQFKGDKDGGFVILANYIGALGNPRNTKPEKIAMTAPVITQTSSEKIAMTAPVMTQSSSEKIAMTAPVITQTSSEKIAMTAPVVTKAGGEEEKKAAITMQFILPSKYGKAEEAPLPVDERVAIREEGERKYGVVKFGGVATDEVVAGKVAELRKSLERDGFKVTGGFLLARYNPPWTLPPFRTNEVMLPIE